MTPATSDEQSRFASMLPHIEGRLKRKFNCSPEAQEDCIAIAVGHAFALFLSATRRHKRVTPGTLAYFAAKMTYSGRQLGSRWTKYDALAAKTGKVEKPLSLSSGELDELLEDRKNAWPTVLDRVAFQTDWTEFMAAQSKRNQGIVGMLAKGYRRSEAAHAVGISRPAVTQRMARLRDCWEQYQGEVC